MAQAAELEAAMKKLSDLLEQLLARPVGVDPALLDPVLSGLESMADKVSAALNQPPASASQP